MGCCETIHHDRFPAQSHYVGCRVQVVFWYDTDHELPGRIVRSDRESPHQTIIALDDGRYVLASECQYRFDALHTDTEPPEKRNP